MRSGLAPPTSDSRPVSTEPLRNTRTCVPPFTRSTSFDGYVDAFVKPITASSPRRYVRVPPPTRAVTPLAPKSTRLPETRSPERRTNVASTAAYAGTASTAPRATAPAILRMLVIAYQAPLPLGFGAIGWPYL